jgi:hypothetical protein
MASDQAEMPEFTRHCLSILSNEPVGFWTLLPGESDEQPNVKLRVENLDNPDSSYACLSYTWGNPKVTKPIKVHGEELQVTTTYYDCLIHLRRPDRMTTIWIDAIWMRSHGRWV